MTEFQVLNDCRGEWINDCPFPTCTCSKLDKTIQSNFMQVVPNSQFFTTLDQIHASLLYGATNEYIRTGIQNSIKMGYKITK